MRSSPAALIRTLKLKKHPEGGHYREVYRSSEHVFVRGLPVRYRGARAFSTSIYFLLQEEEFSAFHRIDSDEIWHFYAGDPLDLFVITPRGLLKKYRLGPGHFQQMVPHGCWFAGEIAASPTRRKTVSKSFALLGCTVAPGFDFSGFELARAEALSRRYPKHRKLITRLTRA